MNFEDCGDEIVPKDWDRELSSNASAVVLDVRNKYESEVGAFENALPLNTTQFKETWSTLREILKDKPKNEPVYMYCTLVGILHVRCRTGSGTFAIPRRGSFRIRSPVDYGTGLFMFTV